MTVPVGLLAQGPSGGQGVARELLRALPQSIVCSSVIVCLSLRSEPVGGERSGWLVDREKEACPSQRRVGKMGARQLIQPAQPTPSARLGSPRKFQALLI